jgi:hypothetical protein
MSQLRLKQIAGPADSKDGSVIIFDSNKPHWSTDLTSSLKLPKGTTLQRPTSAEQGMIRFNTTVGGVEFHTGSDWKRLDADLSIYMQRYIIRMEYTTDYKVGAISGLPTGWSVVSQGDTSFVLYTGLGRPPGGGAIYGQEFPEFVGGGSPTQYQYRAFGSAVEINYDSSNLNQFSVVGITAKTLIGTDRGGHAYFHFYI